MTEDVTSTGGAGIEQSWQHDMWQPGASSVGNGGDEFLRQMLNQGTATGLSKSVHIRQSHQATQDMNVWGGGGQTSGSAQQQTSRMGGGWVDLSRIWSQPQPSQTAVPQAASNGNTPAVQPLPPQQNQQQYFQFLREAPNAADVQFVGNQQKEHSSFQTNPTINSTHHSGHQQHQETQQAANGGVGVGRGGGGGRGGGVGGGGAEAEQGGGNGKKRKLQRKGVPNKVTTSEQQVTYFPPRAPDSRPAGTSPHLMAPGGTTGGGQSIAPAGAPQARSQSLGEQQETATEM